MRLESSDTNRSYLVLAICGGVLAALSALAACGKVDSSTDTAGSGGTEADDSADSVDIGDVDDAPDAPVYDRDGDGLNNELEEAHGLNPDQADSDGDGCIDYFDLDFPECTAGDLQGLGATCLPAWLDVPLADTLDVGRQVELWLELPADGAGGASSNDKLPVLAETVAVSEAPARIKAGRGAVEQCCTLHEGIVLVATGEVVARDPESGEELARYRFFVQPEDWCTVI